MKKNYLLAVALALTAMVGCTDESFVGDQGLKEANEGVGAISFNSGTPAITRADDKTGSDAATDLDNQFIIWGEKNEAGTGAEATAANLVFKNYQVNYTANTAYNTTSNTKDWEYVGYTHSNTASTDDYQTNILPSLSSAQTIKYWDYGATKYTFTAVSAKKTDLQTGKVKIKKLTTGESSSDYNKGYEITVGTDASVDNIFVADRNVISGGTGTDRTATNAYGGNVTMRFRNLMSKIRFGIYETIPGYKVNITDVDYNSTNSKSSGKFGVDGKFLAIGDGSSTNTIFTVTYDSNNKAVANLKAASTPGTSTYLETAQTVAECPILSSSAASPISTTSATPTWDKTDGAYTTIMPYTTNDGNMKVKLDFTLTSTDTGETINVTDATAEIPAAYCQWKSNYAYTYILKLNDNTNGQIGGVTGLYPITFDAVEITDETGSAEYITTVSEPSITTFGAIYNTSDTKYTGYQTGKDEYQAQTGSNRLDIYATFTEGSTVQTPVLGESGAQHVNVFKVTTPNADDFPITEASVAEAIANPASITNAVWTCAVTDVAQKTATDLTNDDTYYKKDANNKAPGDAGYVVTPAVKNTDYTIGASSSENTITDGVNIYTCTVTYTPEASAAALTAGTTYYKSDGSHNPGTTDYVPTIAVHGTDYQLAPKITATSINDDSSTNFTAAPAVVNDVPAEDDTTKSINALKLTGVKAGTYAIEYEASAAWTGTYNKVYKVIKVSAAE